MGRIADMQQAEKERKKKKKKIVLVAFVVVGAIVAILVHPILGAVIALTPLVVNAMLDVGKDISVAEVDLGKKIKEELAPKVIQMSLPESEYYPYEGIEEEKYNQAEYVESITGYKSDDKIIPRVVTEDDINLQIEFAEVSFKIEGESKRKFVGVLGCVTLPKDIRSKVKINREGTYEKDYFFKANIENDEFESKFDVMSPNKTLAIKLLTQELMEKILSVRNTYGYNIDINVIRNKLYIRVESGSMIIETKDGLEIDRNIMEKRYTMLKAVTELMRDISKTINVLVI